MMHTKRFFNPAMAVAMAVLLLAMAGSRALAINYLWTGNEDTRWGNPDNWYGGPGGTYPEHSTDTADILVVTSGNYPDLDVGFSVPAYGVPLPLGKLTIRDGATVTVGENNSYGRALRLQGTPGSGDGIPLDIKTGGILYIEREGMVSIAGGGMVKIAGTGKIRFSAGNGDSDLHPILEIDGAVEIESQTGANDDEGDIVAPYVRGVILGRSSTGAGFLDAAESVLVLGHGHDISGLVTIAVQLVNNGTVHADRAGDLELCCCPKSGAGTWKVSHADAVLVVKVPVTGANCSLFDISAGTVLVNQSVVSCGQMSQTGGKIKVLPKVIFDIGNCPAGHPCGCGET